MINFKDKKILVTGATGGIGKALVKSPIQIYSILFLFEIDSFASNKVSNFNIFFNFLFIFTVLYFCNSLINNLAKKQINKKKLQ